MQSPREELFSLVSTVTLYKLIMQFLKIIKMTLLQSFCLSVFAVTVLYCTFSSTDNWSWPVTYLHHYIQTAPDSVRSQHSHHWSHWPEQYTGPETGKSPGSGTTLLTGAGHMTCWLHCCCWDPQSSNTRSHHCRQL